MPNDQKSDDIPRRITIGKGDTDPVFTWYRIDSKICSIAEIYSSALSSCDADMKFRHQFIQKEML